MPTRAPKTSTPKSSAKAPTPARRKSAAKARVEDGTVVTKKRKTTKKKKAARKKRRVFTAKTADRHELYQLSVQSPKEDVSFLSRVYKSFRKKKALHFREDFCGTSLLSATWVARGKEYTAEGFDIDPDPLSWGIAHNFEPLGENANRATLHMKDVREPSNKKPDVRCAQNFSYFVFKKRAELLEYCRAACKDLAKDGVFVMDIYGGPESMEEMEEVRKIDEGFTYVWDQVSYFPATADYKAHIHFRFKDGSEIKRAFSYDWRLWTLPEVKDILLEAGFSAVETYWEGTDEDGESGNGVYRRSKKGENCLAWVTYLVALK